MSWFIYFITNIYEVEKLVAYKNFSCHKFDKHWGRWKNFFELTQLWNKYICKTCFCNWIYLYVWNKIVCEINNILWIYVIFKRDETNLCVLGSLVYSITRNICYKRISAVWNELYSIDTVYHFYNNIQAYLDYVNVKCSTIFKITLFWYQMLIFIETLFIVWIQCISCDLPSKNKKKKKKRMYSLKLVRTPLNVFTSRFLKLSFSLCAPITSDECHAWYLLNAASPAARNTE